MDYSTSHFGKSLNDLTLDDVVQFFSTERIETDQLEFKSFGGELNNSYRGIIRTICAFLNSKGGLLIWGAPNGTTVAGRREKIFIGELKPLPVVLEKDTVISRCSDSITPLPNGIRVRIIEGRQVGCVCIFEADESNYSPHQFENTYYMRIDGQNKPAPHHYIEALFRKIRYPQLEGYLKFNRAIRDMDSYRIVFDVFVMNWSPLQNAIDISFRVISDKGVFPAAGTNNNYANDGHEWRKESFKSVLSYGEPVNEVNAIQVDVQRILDGEELYVILIFGARNVPSKASEYRLSLKPLLSGTLPEKAIVDRTENQLFKDIQDGKGVTKEDTLRMLLGR